MAYRDNRSGSTNVAVKAFSVLPRLYTLPITGISSTSGVSGGEIYYSDKLPISSRGICWNTTGSPIITDAHTIETGSFVAGTFTASMTGLTLGQKYYVRAYATNSAGTDYGHEISFITKTATPDIYTSPITSITSTTATSGGNITDIKESNVIARGVCWNTTGSPSTSDAHTTESGTFGTGTFTASMTGLTLGQKYYVRAYATNSAGTDYGHEVSFTTYNPENVNKMSFQGVIKDALGRLLNDGSYNIIFKLYTALTGGTQVWTETQSVSVSRGMINVNLGSVNPITGLSFNTSYWLGISVGGGTELLPRTAVTGSAYPYGNVGE